MKRTMRNVGSVFLAIWMLALPAGCRPEKASPGGEEAPVPAAAPAAALAAGADAELLAEGKENWRGCAACHCATDSRIVEDADWVLLNEVTTCIESGAPATRFRKSIIAYLNDPGTLKPVLVDEETGPIAGVETGKVAVPKDAGSAFLRADRGTVKTGSPALIRLVWKASAVEKFLDVPVGDYIVVGTWLYRRGGPDQKERWMASVTNVEGCSVLQITPEVACSLVLDPLIRGELSHAAGDGAFSFAFSMTDISANKLTLSKNGRVVGPKVRIAAGGEPLRTIPFVNT